MMRGSELNVQSILKVYEDRIVQKLGFKSLSDSAIISWAELVALREEICEYPRKLIYDSYIDEFYRNLDHVRRSLAELIKDDERCANSGYHIDKLFIDEVYTAYNNNLKLIGSDYSDVDARNDAIAYVLNSREKA